MLSPKNPIELSELDLPQTLEVDYKRLKGVDVPIVTTSASFRGDIFKNFGERARLTDNDIVFSRAHFSMSIALLRVAHEMGLSAWFIDPTNYVTKKDWDHLKFVVMVGQLVARFPFLKRIKDTIDTITRGNLPITRAITKPLLYVTANDTTPVLSVHYETGNILAAEGRTVLQVVTDPHIRPQYLLEAGRKNMHFAVFDKQTKEELLNKAKEQKIELETERVVVTGPPVDPIIVRARKDKKTENFKKRPLRLCITTGGLGQNKDEILKSLESIAPEIKAGKIHVILYASTLPDFKDMYEEFVKKHKLPLGKEITETSSPVRIIYSTSIIEANQALIDHAFSWADGFITKPSGDMAYDAAGAGCFILALTPWGDWEQNILKIFSNLSILKEADTKNLAKQIKELEETGWIQAAINNALKLDKLYLTGAKNIVELQQKLTKS